MLAVSFVTLHDSGSSLI